MRGKIRHSYDVIMDSYNQKFFNFNFVAAFFFKKKELFNGNY